MEHSVPGVFKVNFVDASLQRSFDGFLLQPERFDLFVFAVIPTLCPMFVAKDCLAFGSAGFFSVCHQLICDQSAVWDAMS